MSLAISCEARARFFMPRRWPEPEQQSTSSVLQSWDGVLSGLRLNFASGRFRTDSGETTQLEIVCHTRSRPPGARLDSSWNSCGLFSGVFHAPTSFSSRILLAFLPWQLRGLRPESVGHGW